MDAVWAGMDLKTLYKSSWGAKNARGEEFDELVRTDFEPRRLRMQQEGVEQGWLRPRGVYGYFRCAADGEALVIFDEGGESELGRLQFPRQERHDRLAIPDYFRTIDDDERDIVAFQVVTVGREAQDHVDALYAAEEYSEQYFAHGIAIAATEGMAEALHRRVKREMGIDGRPGPALLVGLPGVPRSRAPRAGVRPAGRPGGDRHRPHVGVPARPGAVDGRDRRAPSVGGVLQRAPFRPRDCVAIGRRRIGARRPIRTIAPFVPSAHRVTKRLRMSDSCQQKSTRPSASASGPQEAPPAGFRKVAGYTRFDIPPATGNSKLAPCDVTVPTPLPETSIVLRLGARA